MSRVHDVVGSIFFFQAEDGIRDLVRSRGLGDVYKRQKTMSAIFAASWSGACEAMRLVRTTMATSSSG